MEYLNFSSLNEKDFDEIIFDAGGKRYTDDLKIQELNCDYILDNAVLELKIIEEEPLGKKEKQQKFIELFEANAETVILYPFEKQKYQYFKILQSPIQKALKKASKQLQKSAKEINAQLKIAIIMNNGLYMVSNDEFKKMAVTRAKNDTSGIDILIVCSMYYHSDKLDMNIMFGFDDIEINQVENYKNIINKLRSSWNKKIESYMTEQLLNKNLVRNKKPIQDLFFESKGIRYIKPPMQWGEKSTFWKNGRQREDTTNKNDLPLICVIPMFDITVYRFLKDKMPNSVLLQNSLSEYIKFIEDYHIKEENRIKLRVYLDFYLDDLKNLPKQFNESDIQNFIDVKYETLYNQIKNEMIEYKGNLECDDFILLETQEIGMDKANDIAFISHIKNNLRQEYFLDGIRIKYEYAVAVAITLCMIVKAKKVCFIRNEDFKWN